jgi:hypothetical protein
MLDIGPEAALTEDDWASLPSRAELPCSWAQYAAGQGGTHNKPNSRRQYARIGLRRMAILWVDGEPHAAYTTDVSKIGVGFYSPVNIMPNTVVRLWISGQSVFPVRVRRCRRLQERCFDCGAVFVVAGAR